MSATPKDVSNDDFKITRNTKNTVIPTPMPPTSHQNKPPSRPQVRPLESDAALVSVKRRSVFMLVGGWRFGGMVGGLASSEVADADGAVRVEAEDFVKGEHRGRRGGNDGTAENGHL